MKKKFYLTLDTETATLPFANALARNPKEKQKIAIAKPIVYDIGWVITDRNGNEIKRENYLVQETFFVPNIFNTAYYKDKRPIYLKLLKENKIKVDLWDNIIEKLLEDLRRCDIATAYNATFDYKKAIPFTERYITNLYSENYNRWENLQKKMCIDIINGNSDSKNEKYLEPIFELRGEEFPVLDLWGIACERLVNNSRYKDFCLKNGFLTNSGIYFKTSAETTFAYLTRDEEFIESHTALDDSIIESHILTKILKKGKVEPSLKAFPFRALGETYKYVSENKKYIDVVIDKIKDYLFENGKENSYTNRLKRIVKKLEIEKTL